MNLERRTIAGALLTTIAALAFAAAAPHALARRGGGGRVRREYRLVPTAAGRALRLKGNARTETRSDREKVKVEVESKLDLAGRTVDVYVRNPAQSTAPIFLATLTLRHNTNPREDATVRAQAEFGDDSGAPLPTGISPVNRITGFLVRNPASGEVLLNSTRR